MYTPRIDGFLDNIKAIDPGLNKYTTLKLDSIYENVNMDLEDHQTTEEEEEREKARF
jgi:hypothetical protein